ncbi:AAA family ATPase [Ruminococcus sp.]|uniref:ParA family protein n=1 Tax=Ruminococcus sp. TaxID=41978 RepID=UPI0025EA04CC|nr:AAA family ATPase [Ruminococcus sp.]
MSAKKIVLFNHKGGVSKTLTTYNIAWMIALQGKRVLLVDCDPQCNMSALILGDFFDDYYMADETKNANVKDGLKVAFESRPEPIRAVKCHQVEGNANLFLLPGHMDLSEYEPSLSLAMNNNNSMTALQNLPGALNRLIELCAEENNIDYIFVDINPGLSAINQIAFTLADRFIVPTNPDPFSLMALKTLLKVLPRWKYWADNTRPLLEEASYPLPNADMKFIGEVSQRFNRRNRKPTASYITMIDEIKKFVNGEFAEKLKKNNMICAADDYHLAEIPDFGAMLQKSNLLGMPVYSLPDNELPGGATFENTTAKRDEIKKMFLDISNKIMESFNE